MSSKREIEIRRLFNARVNLEKRWPEYLARRNEIIAGGIPESEAWLIAAKEFPPLNGGKGEWDTIADEEPASETKESQSPERVKLALPTPPKNNRQWPVTHRPSGPKLDAKWSAIAKQVPAAKVGSEREVARWVFENAWVTDADDVDVASAPSRGAVTLLHWVIHHPSGYHEFLTSIWVKTMPNQQQLKGDKAMNDDGRRVLSLFDRIDAELDEGVEVGSE
jgi:hypothetical protein